MRPAHQIDHIRRKFVEWPIDIACRFVPGGRSVHSACAGHTLRAPMPSQPPTMVGPAHAVMSDMPVLVGEAHPPSDVRKIAIFRTLSRESADFG